MNHRLIATATISIAVIVSTACGSTKPSACGPVIHDPLDPGSGSHVLPGAPTPSYLINPPTSGAHQPSPPIHGVQTAPLAPQIQVGILEEGHVLLQYHGLSRSDIDELAKLTSEKVVVAPAKSLPNNAKVVATAWVTHQSCTTLDVSTLQTFIDDHAKHSEDHDH